MQFKTRGFSLVEMLVVIAIIAIVSALLFSVFSNFRRNQVLNSSVEIILSSLNEARNKTLAAEAGTNYGIRLASTSVTLFRGSTYSSSDPNNKVTHLPGGVVVTGNTLSGNKVDVIFNRLTGKTSQAGNIRVEVVGASTTFRTIIVRSTGASGVN